MAFDKTIYVATYQTIQSSGKILISSSRGATWDPITRTLYATNLSGSFVGTIASASYATSASYAITASYVIGGGGTTTGSFTGSFTGSLLGTAQTASYVLQAVSASYATTASYALNGGGGTTTGSFTGSFTGSLFGKDATGGYAGLTLFKINFKNAANTFTSFFTNSNTASRTYLFKDRDGTIMDDTDYDNINTALGLKAPLVSPTLTTPTLGVASGTSLVLSSFLNEAKGANIASASTTNIGAGTGNYINITGTTTITAFDTVQAGTRRILNFNGILTLTYNATSLILPTSANIVTEAGDVATFVSLGSGNWVCISYNRASGKSVYYQGYTLQGGGASLSPADATSYFYGPHYGQAPPTTGGFRRLYIPKSGTIKSCYLFFTNTVAGTSETSTIYIRVNNTTDNTVSSSITNDANPTIFNNTALSIAVVAGDFIELKWATPAWVTNPISVFNWVIYIE